MSEEKDGCLSFVITLEKGLYTEKGLINSIKDQLKRNGWNVEDGLFGLFETICVAEKDDTLCLFNALAPPDDPEGQEDSPAEKLLIAFSARDDKEKDVAVPTSDTQKTNRIIGALTTVGIPVPGHVALDGSVNPGYISVRIYLLKDQFTHQQLKDLYQNNMSEKGWILDTGRQQKRTLQFENQKRKCIAIFMPLNEESLFTPQEAVDHISLIVLDKD